MPETPDQAFSRMVPGADPKTAKRTAKGNPYILEQGNFEAGTYGQRMEGKPIVRMSPNAKPYELTHELEHVDQLYAPGGMEALDAGYDEPRMANVYASYGLTQDDAGWLAYANRPTELAARRAAGDPDVRYAELMQQIARVKASRARRAPDAGAILAARGKK